VARQVLLHERAHLAPGLADLHRLLGRGAAEVSAEGPWVELSDGRSVLDFGSYAVTLLGHRHPRVVQAVRDALDLLPTSTRLLPNAATTGLASRLAEVAGGGTRSRVVLGLNGSDVVEASLKLAMAATGIPRLIAVQGAFHGKTLGALAVTDDDVHRRPFLPLFPHVRFVEPEPGAVADALREEPAAAVIFEPIQGEGGGRAIPADVLRAWSDDIHRQGGFVIVDEIQVGLRRCGPLSLTQELEIPADAVLLGKPLGGGVMPLSAAVCSDELYRPLLDDPFFHTATFGGHPLSCAAGVAALECLDDLGPAVDALAPVLDEGLRSLALRHPGVVTTTRAFGVFGVVDATTVEAAHLLLAEAARRGVLLAPCLGAPTTLRVLPPAIADPTDVVGGLGILDEACIAVGRRLGMSA